MRVHSGLRIGFWNRNAYSFQESAFTPLGHYVGDDLGDHIPGALLQQNLMEGPLQFQVGVLFRPDLGKRDRLETILILVNYVPEMFEYTDWRKADN